MKDIFVKTMKVLTNGNIVPSRTPSANKEPSYRLRYDNPIGASPSRNLDHPKPFDEEEYDRSVSCRSTSLGRSSAVQAPSYNGKCHWIDNNYQIDQIIQIL